MTGTSPGQRCRPDRQRICSSNWPWGIDLGRGAVPARLRTNRRRGRPGVPRGLATSDQRARVPNLFIKIPGTAEGLPAIEEAIIVGVPVNVTLLFSRRQYLAAAGAYLRGVERRIEVGLNPAVAPVASG